jgi:hypothetical protein
MVKPPGNFGRGRVLEVDDGVFIAIKIGFIKERARAMHQTAELKIHVRADALAVKAGKQRRRCRPIKALAVKKDPDFQAMLACSLKNLVINKATRNDIPGGVLSNRGNSGFFESRMRGFCACETTTFVPCCQPAANSILLPQNSLWL